MPKASTFFDELKQILMKGWGVSNFNVTRRALSLGAVDTITGWPAKSFAETTIDMVTMPKGTTFNLYGIGFYARHDYTGYTDDTVAEGDEITLSSEYYQVNAVTPVKIGTTTVFSECDLVKQPLHADRPSTSGTWLSVGDPAYRVKAWLDTYLTAANMKEDNNSTNATTLVAMGLPDYPIYPVFITATYDMIFSVERSRSTALIGHDKTAYGYHEETPIKIYAVDKSGLTARRLVWTGEREIRRIAESYAIGTVSVRTYASGKEAFQPLGGTMLYCLEVTVDWVRDTT